MKKELKIEDFGAFGEGVSHSDENTYFVPRTLKDEIVEVEVLETKKNLNFCKAIKIKNKSDKRREPFCKYYDLCGGCDFQHTTYENSLEIKRESLIRTIKKISALTPDVEEVQKSPKENYYRNKITLSVLSNNGQTKIGLKEDSSHKIVEVEECKIVNKNLNKLIKISNEIVSKLGNIGYNEKQKIGVLKNIVALSNEEEILVTLVVEKRNEKLEKLFANSLKNIYKSYGLFVNINNKKTKKILSEKFIHIDGIKNLTNNSNGIIYPISPYSFMQINEEIKEQLYSKVLSFCKDFNCVIDAYSGAGLMSAMLAKNNKKVVAVEINKSATSDAVELAKNNHITNIENINGDCSLVLPKLKIDSENLCVVLDPPRSGCDKLVLEKVMDLRPRQIVYISCAPSTLSRDLNLLKSLYEIDKVIPYDMFAWTKHLETVVKLDLKEK